MARRLQCNSCKGIYPDTRDGSAAAYFHVCPPEMIDTYALCDAKGDTIKEATFKPTPNPRNENLKRDPANPGKFVLVSEGSGVTVLE